MSEQVHIYSGEHNAYWRPNGEGYTTDALDAGVWSREEAESRIRGAGPEKKLKLLPVKSFGEAIGTAWQDWLRSEQGQKAANGSANGQYLENRLWWAFMAGAKAAEKIAAKRSG